MSIVTVSKNTIKTKNLTYLANTIFGNFIEFRNFTEINHNLAEIYRVLRAPNSHVHLYMINKKIAGYLVGEVMTLSDGRTVFFITYLYTAKKYRNKNIASSLISFIQTKVKRARIDGMMLTYDSENEYLDLFYKKKGFMPDMTLRTYTRFDTLYKQLH